MNVKKNFHVSGSYLPILDFDIFYLTIKQKGK
jgi:hypothetical protein